jgi:ribose-phosphate pyrophosphokinase
MSADKLYELGASEIYLFVTHAEHSIFKGSLFSSHINKVFTTNTIINEVDVPEAVKPLIKIFDVIGGK